MISIELNDKIIKVIHSEKVFDFTDESGQIEVNTIIAFLSETSLELLKGEITYPTENDQLVNGLKFFINTLFGKLCDEKSKEIESIPLPS